MKPNQHTLKPPKGFAAILIGIVIAILLVSMFVGSPAKTRGEGSDEATGYAQTDVAMKTTLPQMPLPATVTVSESGNGAKEVATQPSPPEATKEKEENKVSDGTPKAVAPQCGTPCYPATATDLPTSTPWPTVEGEAPTEVDDDPTPTWVPWEDTPTPLPPTCTVTAVPSPTTGASATNTPNGQPSATYTPSATNTPTPTPTINTTPPVQSGTPMPEITVTPFGGLPTVVSVGDGKSAPQDNLAHPSGWGMAVEDAEKTAAQKLTGCTLEIPGYTVEIVDLDQLNNWLGLDFAGKWKQGIGVHLNGTNLDGKYKQLAGSALREMEAGQTFTIKCGTSEQTYMIVTSSFISRNALTFSFMQWLAMVLPDNALVLATCDGTPIAGFGYDHYSIKTAIRIK